MTKRIIVADDEAHILHVVSMKLRNAGYEVQTAEDGEEALELCQADPPAMLITDYQMPYMTGVELCKALRQCEATKGVPAMMLTARGFDIEPPEMIEAGIAAVLAKPFSPREVLSRVVDLVGQPEDSPVGV